MFFYGAQESQNFSSKLGEKTFTGEELMAMWYNCGAEMRVSGTSHAAVLRDVRSVIFDVIRDHLPEGSQKEIARAHRQWRYHAAFRNQLYKFFHVSASQRAPSEPGTSLLTAFAAGKASFSERAFVREFRQVTGVQWPPELKTTS